MLSVHVRLVPSPALRGGGNIRGTGAVGPCLLCPLQLGTSGAHFEHLGARLQHPPALGIPFPLLCCGFLVEDQTTSFCPLALMVKVNAESIPQLQTEISMT